jgi:hypothetical protein
MGSLIFFFDFGAVQVQAISCLEGYVGLSSYFTGYVGLRPRLEGEVGLVNYVDGLGGNRG